MRRAGRAVVGTLLVAVGVGGVALGLTIPSTASTASPYLTAKVTRATVVKSISDSGSIVDQYTYAIAPKSDPVLTERDGVSVNKSAGAQGYTVSSLKVTPGDTVDKNDVLAEVTDSNDKKSKVKAPYDGRVRSVTTAKGAVASTIATLGVGRQDIAVDVSEYDVTRLKIHQNADLQLDANGETFDGSVASISPTAETSSGVQTYQVVLRTSDLPSSARLGMTVTTTIAVKSAKDVLTVPLTAVSGTGSDATVQVVDDQGKARTQAVSVGLVGDSLVEITKGLQADQQVVTGIPGAGAATASASPGSGGPFRGGN